MLDQLVVIVIVVLLLNWDKGKKFNFKEFIIQILFFIAVSSILKIVWIFVKRFFHFSIPQIPDYYEAWIGGGIFLAFSCTLSILGWKQLNKLKRDKS